MTGYESKRAMAQDKLAQPAAPEVWMFQHDETGRVTCILNDGINTPELFLEMNPRYALIGSPNSLKRPWVGLTKEDMPNGEDPMFDHEYFIAGMVFAATILKEKNT